MKNFRQRPSILAGSILAATLLSLNLGQSAKAGSLTWDGSNTTNSQADGGAGTWDANTTANWWNGTTNVVWPNTGTDNDAIFGNVAGTVTIDAGGVTANDLTFNTTGYVLSGAGTLTLNGTTPTVRLGSGISASIGAVLAGTNGLVKAGNGTLILNGSTANTLTGGVTVNGGTLNVNLGNLASATNLVDASNTLTLGGGTLQVTGNATQVSSQTFANTVVTSGSSTIRATQGASLANNITIQVGAVTHTAGGVLSLVTANSTINNTTLSTSEIFRTTGLASGATLGSWAFVNDSTTSVTRWAQVVDGSGRIGTISGVAATASTMANVTDATKIYTATGAFTLGAPKTAFGIQATNNSTYTLGSNSLTTDGLLSINSGTTMTFTGSTGIVVGAGNELVIAGAGNVTISTPISNKAGNSSNLTYAGGGTLTLDTAASTYTGLTTVNSGTVALGLNNVLNGASGIVVNGGTLSLSTFNQSVASVKIAGGTIAGAGGTLASASAIDAQNGTVSAILTGSGGLNKTTSGLVTLSGMNTYTGATNITGGRLDVTGSLTSNITVGAGTTLGGEGTTSGSVTFTGASTFAFDPTTAGSFKANTINATGATVTISPTTTASGTDIVIMEALGGITGVPGTNFLFSGRGTAHLGVGNTQLLFDYSPGSVVWRGNDASHPTFWDVNASTNWQNGANPDKYFNGDAVTFDDTASTFTVDVQSGGVLPGTMTFNNSTHTYTVQGAAISGTASLVKNGTGTLILANANTYSGTTTINAGTVQLGNGTLGGALGTGAITNNGAIVTNMGSTTGAIAGDISGTGTVTQSGTGTVTLTGTNSYSGLTTVNAGTLQIGSGGTTGTLGTNSVVVNAGGTIAFNRSDDISITNVISGAGGLKKSGAGTLTLGTSNTYSGTTTISGGAILLNATSGILGDTTSGTVVNSGGALQLQGGLVFSGESLSLAGEGVNATTAAGALRSIGGNNEWAANITVLAAPITRVAVDLNSSLNISGNITLSPTATDQFVLQGAGTGEISGVISGAGRLTKGSGNSTTWVLSGANTYTGKTVISNGFLKVSSINSVVGGSASSNLGTPVDVASGTIDLGGTQAAGGLMYAGTGETTDRVINLPGSTAGGTLDQSGTGLLKFTSDLTAAAGSKTLILQGSTAGTGEFAGAIGNGSGTIGIRKNGTGTWTLSGANTYTGVTSITNGTLALGATGSLSGTSSINITGGATFDVSALPGGFTLGSTQTITGGVGATAGAITGTLIVSGGASVVPGPSAGGLGTLSVSNGFSLLSGAHLSLDLSGLTPGSGYDQVVVSSGNISLAGDLVGSTISLTPTNFTDVFYIIINGGTGTTTGTLGAAEGGMVTIGSQQFQISYTSDFGGTGFAIGGTGNDVALLAVPEPGSIVSLLGGLGLLLGVRRRR